MIYIKDEIVEVMDNIINKIENKKKVKFNTNLNIKTYEVEKIRFKVSDQRRNIQKRKTIHRKWWKIYYTCSHSKNNLIYDSSIKTW